MGEIEEQLKSVEKSLGEVAEVLKFVPTASELRRLDARIEALEESDIGKSVTLDDSVEEIVKAAVSKAVAPLEARIEELENAPVVKGVQDFDIAKAAGRKTSTPEKVDVIKGILHTEYPELRR